MSPAAVPSPAVPPDVAVRPPDPPPAAAAVFGPRLELAQFYVAALATAGVERGLIGPREVPRLWDRHLLNCAVVAELVPEGVRVVDVGSGAGLPGIAVALARPDLDVTLLEPSVRRSTFLTEVVQRLGLVGVEVVRGRAEEGRRGPFDLAMARAVAPLSRLVGWCLPLVAGGGRLLAIKGTSAQAEVAAAAAELAAAGASPPTIRLCGRGVIDPPTTVVDIVPAPSRKRQR